MTALVALAAALAFRSEIPSSAGGLEVARVVDGDTAVLSDGQKVRYLLIDTPEEGEPLYEQARRANAELVEAKLLRIELDAEPRDSYGRTLAHLFVPDGRGGEIFVNAELVRRGLARLYVVGENVARRDEILQAQREAIEARRGMWEGLGGSGEEAPVVGTDGRSGRHRFHREDCRAIAGRGSKLRRFESRERALWEGRSPCRACRP